ncbi:hypothetical protein PHYC_00367 [Phycisphaerales bacterium]|nr:hypothetical protein PHYC_00367 [Phycisphaerales bacterium]
MAPRRSGNQSEPSKLEHAIAAVAPQIRRELMVLVAQRPRCIQDLAARVDLDRTLVSKHLNLLRSRGLLGMTRDGHRHVYHVSNTAAVVMLAREAMLIVKCQEGCDVTVRMTESQLRRLRLFPSSPIARLPVSRLEPMADCA